MTPAEYRALDNPTLPHAARSLYCIKLRAMADQAGATPEINYPELGKALAVRDPVSGDYRFQITPSQLTQLFDDLIRTGLLHTSEQPHPNHYHGARFRLPLLRMMAQEPLPKQQFPMHLEWRPDHEFISLAKLCGLSDPNYRQDELGEFIAFWLGRPETFKSQHQWMMQFIRNLKNGRYIHRVAQTTSGYQVDTPTTYVESEKSRERAREMIEAAAQFAKRNDDEQS